MAVSMPLPELHGDPHRAAHAGLPTSCVARSRRLMSCSAAFSLGGVRIDYDAACRVAKRSVLLTVSSFRFFAARCPFAGGVWRVDGGARSSAP